MKSIKACKQRKSFYNAPTHKKRKQISSHLEENLLLKYDRRRLCVIKGDTVKVMRGAYRNHEDKVTKVYVKDNLVNIEGITITKADGKKVAKSIHPSNLLITKLNLTDKWRRNNLERGLSEDKKREIESEAKTQLKQLEEEQLKKQELQAELENKEENIESEETIDVAEKEQFIEEKAKVQEKDLLKLESKSKEKVSKKKIPIEKKEGSITQKKKKKQIKKTKINNEATREE